MTVIDIKVTKIDQSIGKLSKIPVTPLALNCVCLCVHPTEKILFEAKLIKSQSVILVIRLPGDTICAICCCVIVGPNSTHSPYIHMHTYLCRYANTRICETFKLAHAPILKLSACVSVNFCFEKFPTRFLTAAIPLTGHPRFNKLRTSSHSIANGDLTSIALYKTGLS